MKMRKNKLARYRTLLTEEEFKDDLEVDNQDFDTDFYLGEEIEKLLEDDEISPEESAFMDGYLNENELI